MFATIEFGRVAQIALRHGLFDVYLRVDKRWKLNEMDFPFDLDVVVFLIALKKFEQEKSRIKN
jgi:hypothetical protein